MSEIDDGGTAFPVQCDEQLFPSYGMSLRDYFAGQALVGFSANPQWLETSHSTTAESAYAAADAMLAARTGKGDQS